MFKKYIFTALLMAMGFTCFIAPPELRAEAKPAMIVSQPKAGTHLLAKLLIMMTERKMRFFFPYHANRHSSTEIDDFIQKGGIPKVHIVKPDYMYDYLTNNHKEAQLITIIRDPRDAFVSLAYFVHRHRNSNLTIQEKIDNVFKNKSYCDMTSKLSLFLNKPRFYIVKFEDLIGAEGGGSTKKQKETMKGIASRLGLKFKDSEITYFVNNLFGNKEGTPRSFTFRKGQIGSWKEHFTKEHIAMFKERFGEELIRLGYEKDLKW